MEYERQFKKTASFPRVDGKRVLTYTALYSDAQLVALGVAEQAALGGAFTSFLAVDSAATQDITIAWAAADAATEIAAIDAAIVAWMEGL